MSSLNPLKISQTHIRSFIYRKHLEIITFISIIGFFCVLLSSQILKTFPNLNINNNYDTSTTNLSLPLIWSPRATFNLTNNIKTTSDVSLRTETLTINEMPFAMKLKKRLNCLDIPLRMEKLQYGQYWLLKNYIRGRKSSNMGCAESITYTTNGDYTFMEHLPRVVERWLAPVSFALYAPGYDYKATMSSIQYVLNCLPESELIRDYVTFHIYFPRDHLPSFIAKNQKEALQWPFDCNATHAPYANVKRSEMYKTVKNLTYPINVGRNIARKSVNTYFIFACDIELYPNYGLVQNFLEMVVENPTAVLDGEKPKVFAMPVFEVKRDALIPDTKEELLQMLNDSSAVPFHVNVCPNCHLVPKQKEWLKANSSEALEIFTMGKRYDTFASWEPFYISDNKEPIFDERVTWEGQSNKRIQNYAMCLLDYEYHILNPAFLVHAPGIKKLNTKSEQFKIRLKYATAMNKIIANEIIPEYAVLYGKNKRCKI